MGVEVTAHSAVQQERLLPRQGGDSEYGTQQPTGWNCFRLSSSNWITAMSSVAVLCRHLAELGAKSSPVYPMHAKALASAYEKTGWDPAGVAQWLRPQFNSQ